jgi:hypothetical protein
LSAGDAFEAVVPVEVRCSLVGCIDDDDSCGDGQGRWGIPKAGMCRRLPGWVATAKAVFDLLTGRNRYAVLYRIDAAQRADTRARRIEQYVATLAAGETIYPQKRRRAR